MTDTPTPPVASQTHDLRSITVALIEVEGRMRPARTARIEVLKQDIDCNGLTHPLLVVRKGRSIAWWLACNALRPSVHCVGPRCL